MARKARATRLRTPTADDWTGQGASPIDAALKSAWVAQLVEQRIENPRVGGSNPPPGTTFPIENRAPAVLNLPPRRHFPIENRVSAARSPSRALPAFSSLKR